MSVLVSLPVESRVGPLLHLPKAIDKSSDNGNKSDDDEKLVFNSFCLEDYAWRFSHERHLKDPLERYRIR